jgi:hypothetical protein
MSKSISSIKTSVTKEPSLDNPVYKVKQLVNGSINTIYVFNGKKSEENEELFKKIFTEDERQQIESEKITVKFSEQQIHFDDSIGTIKIKILNELKKEIVIDEIYLYCQKNENLNAVSVYQSLTQNNKLQLTKVRLEQFLSNIISDESGKPFEEPVEKEVYTFDDIFEMNFNNKNFIINNVLGQKFFIVENEYPFVCNPYDVNDYDKFFERSARKSLTTLNNHLLLSSGNIIDNSIYLCLAEDVLPYLNKKDVSEETTIKVYYPFLYNKNINSLDDLQSQKSKLLENNKKIINEKVIDSFKSIDMFYDVYNLRKNELNYINKGVKFIKAVIRPEFDIKIPLEIIFKVVHATQENPLIKYNPSSRQENVYRLFTDKIAIDGRKIPYLKKAVIFKLMKSIARNKSVAVYVESEKNGKALYLVCEFDEEGYITITSEFNEVVTINEINEIFKNSINPIIEEIKSLLEQSGYKLNKFNNLTDDNVEVKQLTYQTQISIKKALDIETYIGCVSSVFINETNVFKSGKINLRFKRVSNYSKFNSMEAFILEKSDQGLRGDQIIEALLENFPEDLDRKQAIELVSKIANELEIERGVRKSDIKIKNNPGFKTTIELEQETGIITITTENINNINYLNTLPIYLDTIVRLTQDKNSTNYPVKEINKLCSTGEKEDIVIDDIISSSEESAANSEVPSIDPEEEEIQYNKFKTVDINKPKGALSLFFDEGEDEEDFEGGERKGFGIDFEGGDTSSSEESIESDKSSEPKKNTYNGVTVPTGLSSDKASSSSEESIASEKSISSEIAPVESDKKLESFPSSSSEKSVPSEKSVSSEITPVESDKELASFPSSSSEESVPSATKIPTLVPSESKSESEESVPSATKIPTLVPSESKSESEESVPSEKATTPPKTPEFESEESIPSEKSATEIPTLVPSESKSEESEDSIPLPKTPESEESIPSVKSSPKKNTPKKKTSTPKSDDEEEEEEEGEPVPESEDEDEEEIRNIDGMKLNKPYYFQTLIEKKDPVLILKEDTPQYNSYVRTCSSSMRKQPVILTDSQLEKINKEHPGFLREEDVIKYGSTKKNQFNYICPRYWCLKNNTIIDPNDLKEVTGKDGKKELVHPTCGKVLPKGEKKVKPGYYIYEFYKPKPGKKDYKKYPGLITDSHPDGLCLPCCFDKYNTEGRIKANKRCYGEKIEEEKKKDVKGKNEEEEEKEKEEDDYIKGPDKFPLDPGRWGYLPPEIQTMLHEVNADCQISKTNSNLKENHPCLLRHGIEISKTQSFIACLSDAIFFAKKVLDESGKPQTAKILSISDMRKRIIKSISIDTFIKYQNGNLVTDFHEPTKKVDIKKYMNTKLYSKLKIKEDSPDSAYFTKVVSAFENFVDFLSDDDAVIDHVYLWDIVSMPNKYLFPHGVNLVIFKLPKDDITNNVELLCPTNHYSSEFYEPRKPTIIIMKEDNYYEPIYSYQIKARTQLNVPIQSIKFVNKQKEKGKEKFQQGSRVKSINHPSEIGYNNPAKIIKIHSNNTVDLLHDPWWEGIAKEFKEYDSHLSKTMRAVFKEIIKPFFNIICKPLDSMPNVYKAKRPLILYDLVQKLDKYEYKIKKLVLNFNNKVIGVVAEEPGTSNNTGFIPCYPSALDEDLKKDLDYVFMTDLTLWNTYENTVKFLNKLDNRSKKRRAEPDIPCKPAFKIVEDEHVVGVLTNTNQFIQLSQPIRLDEVNPDLDIPSINNNNYIINKDAKPMVNTEVEFTTQHDVDEVRVDYIKKIRLETNFYNVFRNTIRILLNDYENVKIREKIENEMTREYIIYSEKLKNITKLLHDLIKNKIQFTADENYYKFINEVSTCIVKNDESCKDTPNLCLTENGSCNLILPEKNLITKKENEQIYYGRMADELIRYNRIKSFMLQPQTYLSFGSIGYNLRDNEIILIQSLLTQEYFETLIPAITNKYIKYNSYDEVEPIVTQVYDNTIPSLDHAIGRKNEPICQSKINESIASSVWKKCFPDNFSEIEYGKLNSCTFNFIIDLIERKTGKKLQINQVKNELFEEYKKYIEKYIDKITNILILEGKKTLGDQVHAGTLSFSSFIYTDNYFLSPFDLWLLVTKYEIPTIFVCQKYILQTKYEKHQFLAYGDEKDKFAFIVVPGLRPENVPGYKLIQSDKGEIFISLEELNKDCLENIEKSIDDKVSIEEYLDKFTKPLTTNYEKKKPERLIIESDSDKVKPEKKKKLIIEETTPVSSEEYILKPVGKKRQSKKKQIKLKGKRQVPKTNTKKRRLLIVDSSSTEEI